MTLPSDPVAPPTLSSALFYRQVRFGGAYFPVPQPFVIHSSYLRHTCAKASKLPLRLLRHTFVIPSLHLRHTFVAPSSYLRHTFVNTWEL